MTTRAELVVVGAGPAGMRAALAAAGAGCAVTLVDSAARPGGQYHRQLLVEAPGPPAGAPRAFGGIPWRGPADAGNRNLPAELSGHSGITVRSSTTVWAAQPGPAEPGLRLYLRADGGPAEVLDARAVILATGAYDRPLPFPGWELPGVFTVGGMQALWKGHRVAAGQRVALSGTGPFLLPVAAALAEAGVTVVGVYEAGQPGAWARHPGTVGAAPGKVGEALGYLRVLRRYGVPVRPRRAIVRALGGREVSGAVVARLRPDWTVVPGSERPVEVDAIGVGYGFVPLLDLALALGADAVPEGVTVDGLQRTTVPGLYAAGETTGVAGAASAAAQGHLAGLAAAVQLGHLAPDRAAVLGRDAVRERHRQARFARALAEVYQIRPGWQTWLDEGTLICRCEEVPLSAIRHAMHDLLITDLRSVKLACRAGMGMCQGRICGPSVSALLHNELGRAPEDLLSFARRPLTVPVPLGTLAELEQHDKQSSDNSLL